MLKRTTKWIAYTGVMTALCAICTLYISIPSLSGGHTNLSDAIIFITAVLFDPISALIVGGIGTMIADLIAYPTTAVFSLVFHGLEGLLAGVMIKFVFLKMKKCPALFDVISMVLGGIIMVVGFFFAKAFYYGTIESAVISLYRNILQVVISIVVALLVCYVMNLKKVAKNMNILYEYKPKKDSKTDREEVTISEVDNNDDNKEDKAEK